MIKEAFIELINRKAENRWHPDYVAMMIAKGFNQMIYEVFRTDPQQLIHYCSERQVEVKETENVYYSDIDFGLIKVAGVSGGIRLIKTSKGDNIDFVFMSQTQYMLMNDMDVMTITDYVPCVLINDQKVYYKGKRIKDFLGKDLVYYALIPFDDLDDQDQVVLPAGTEATLTKLVYELLGEKPFDDLVNDRNEKTK